MTARPEKTAPSQKRGEARREAILAAAIEIISESGAGRLSMNDVAKRASASKETIYRFFGDRTALLVAVLERHAETTIAACPPPPDGETFEAALARVGRWYLAMASSPGALSFYRYVAGAAEETPALGRAFAATITEPIVSEIAETLRAHGQTEATRAMAEAYLGLLQGKLWNKALVDPGLAITPADIDAQITLASRLFRSALSA